MEPEMLARRQLDFLPKRIEYASHTCAVTKLKKVFEHLEEISSKTNTLSILVVGAGGSYPACLLVAQTIREELGLIYNCFVDVATPQTAIRMLDAKYHLVFGISYSGKTPDMVAVASECMFQNIPFVLLTGSNLEKVKNLYDDDILYDDEDAYSHVISYCHPEDDTGRELGMISMASTLIPAFLVYHALKEDDTDDVQRVMQAQKAIHQIDEQLLEAIEVSLELNPMVHILYDYHTLPTAVDLESKFIESGIANVVLHEKKNFSHGRSMIMLKHDFGMIINLAMYKGSYGEDISENLHSLMRGDIGIDYENNYEKKLATFLQDICKQRKSVYLEMRGMGADARWNLDHMSQVPYLMVMIGEAMGIDIARPINPIPRLANDLFNYEGSF